MPVVHVESGAVVTAIHPRLPSLEALVAVKPVVIPAILLPDLAASAPEPIMLAQPAAAQADSLLLAVAPAPTTPPASDTREPEAFAGPPRMRNAAKRSVARWANAPASTPKPVRSANPGVVPISSPAKSTTAKPKPGMMLASQVTFNPAPAKSLGGWAVQLGAYSSHGRREIAWGKLRARANFLSAHAPTGSGHKLGKAMLYRLSVSGIATRKEAISLCGRIKAAGGDCFVRNMRGDEPMRWALRPKTSERA